MLFVDKDGDMNFTSAFFSPLSMSSPSSFAQCVNPVTGRVEWVPVSADDDDRDVLVSQYGDMLPDQQRVCPHYISFWSYISIEPQNEVFEEAIKRALRDNPGARVLDLGTGTGLLAMMAARAGASQVIAVEVRLWIVAYAFVLTLQQAFPPMSKLATRIIHANGLADTVQVVAKRSTDIVPERELQCQMADIVVAEVFDTELIGEGALSSFQHAMKELVRPGGVPIPQAATVYIQLVSSPTLRKWSDLSGTPYCALDPGSTCGGRAMIHEVQINQLRDITLLTAPMAVQKFDFRRVILALHLQQTFY